jgi:hypothetical protein
MVCVRAGTEFEEYMDIVNWLVTARRCEAAAGPGEAALCLLMS